MRTRTARLKAPFRVRFDDIDLPDTPPDNHVLLRIDACGICGSDLTAAQQNADYKPFGHEIAATILATAPNVTHLRPGDTVTLESGSFCGTCELCRNGRPDLCPKAPSFWSQPAMGFSTHMIAPACCCVPYADLAPEVAALAEPLGVVYDMVKTAAITMGDRVAIVGPGPLGLAAVPLALRAGAATVTVIGQERHAPRLRVAQALGAAAVTADAPLASLPHLHNQFEHVLYTAPARHIPDAFPLLTYGGELTYIGIGTGDATISFDANAFHFRKLQLRASFASPAMYYGHVLRLLHAGVFPTDLLISHRFPLDQLPEAIALCRDHKSSTIKVMLHANA